MARAAGASVILVNGRLAAFFRRRNPAIRVFLPAEEPELSETARQFAQKLAEVAIRYQSRRSGLLISTINDEPAAGHFLGAFLGRKRLRFDRGRIPDAPHRALGLRPVVADEARRRGRRDDTDA